jgi:DNA topoisomerase I
MVKVGRALPHLRRIVKHDLGLDGLVRPGVLAGAVRLLGLGFFCIGGEQYTEEHETFGIATLRRSHVSLAKDEMVFDYPAKGSTERVVTISEPATYKLMRELKKRRGGDQNLPAYKTGSRWVDIGSDELNAYTREAAQGDCSAKTFRRGLPPVAGAVELAGRAEPAWSASPTAKKKWTNLVVSGRRPGQHSRRMPALVHRPEGAGPLRRR